MRLGPFVGMAWKRDHSMGRGFWFRLFGYGIGVEGLKGHWPLWSERYGYRRAWHVLGVCIKPLRRGH